ncbi:DUF445 domain-containing protein [Eleftheria terrae]|uniref:DUF445 domain-containing protein n=1 Tax=Eleftheria terrae TaxID=1597781 RepID=UPI00263AC272|nr:DUF445 domain-containing protein [Eleftheria terrae]WKB53459.1 DUF445 domain-containing protein [Eleftheria terrae]
MDVNGVNAGASDDKASGLARMKRLALGLLLLAALLYGLSTALQGRHPAWSYVAAFAEAAMIGAIADWFAVVALFRRPMGLPIPHTAIVPANKARIGANLANFICSHFLSTPQVLEKLRNFDAAGRLAGWLAAEGHAEQVGGHLKAALRYGLDALDDERVGHFLRNSVQQRLSRVDVARLAGRLLDVLTTQRRHQALLDEVLQQVAALLEEEGVREKIAAVIAREVKYLRYLGLDQLAGQVATGKIVSGVGRIIGEMGQDPAHPLRLRFDEYMAGFIERLKEDPQFRLKGEQLREEVLAHPALADYLRGLWHELRAWLHDDLSREDSGIGRRLTEAARTLGAKLQADTAMREWINAQVLAAAPPSIERYREDIRRYIVARVDAWNTQELTQELERNIGRDLQFVRINGTLVGGLIGLLIHTVTQWLPFLK